jgi:hypothetical protein
MGSHFIQPFAGGDTQEFARLEIALCCSVKSGWKRECQRNHEEYFAHRVRAHENNATATRPNPDRATPSRKPLGTTRLLRLHCFHMDKPTHHDVDVILKLYELRREDRMRKARGWLATYKASNAAEHQAACPPGSDQDAYFRMVLSYWDMAASFVTSGAVNKDLFLQSAGEMLFVWEKTKVTIAETRRVMGNPKYLSNLETVAQALIDNMNSANPKAYETFAARVRGAGA